MGLPIGLHVYYVSVAGSLLSCKPVGQSCKNLDRKAFANKYVFFLSASSLLSLLYGIDHTSVEFVRASQSDPGTSSHCTRTGTPRVVLEDLQVDLRVLLGGPEDLLVALGDLLGWSWRTSQTSRWSYRTSWEVLGDLS